VQHAYLLSPAKEDQSITFDPLAPKTFGDAAFNLSATSTSGLPVSFSVVSGPATINGSTLTIIGAGDVTVRASQAGDAQFKPATDVDQTFTVAKAAASISLSNLAQTYDGSPKSASATTSPVGLSGVALTYDGSATAPTNAGSYAVAASLTNANYSAADATGTLVISSANQTITFAALSNKTFGDAPFALTATASSGLSVGYQIVSGPATVLGSTLSITGVGVVTVRASQPGDGNYNAATNVDRTFTVIKATPLVNISSSPNPSDSGVTVTFTATLIPAVSGTVTFRDGATTLAITSLTGGSASFQTSLLAVGSHSITATYNGQDANYGVSQSAALFHSVSATAPAQTTTAVVTDSNGNVVTDSSGNPVTQNQGTAQVSVDSNTITTTLPNTPDGQNPPVTVSAVSTLSLPSIPSGYEIGGAGLAFEITAPAGAYNVNTPVAGVGTVVTPIHVCFQVPTVTDEATFNTLSIIHYVNGVPEVVPTSHDFATKTICGDVTSLSPFLIAHAVGVTSASFVGGINTSPNPLLARTSIAIGAVVKDIAPGSTVTWLWDDGTTTAATIGSANPDGSKNIIGSHAFTAPGLFIVHLRVKSPAGSIVEAAKEVFVYDPNAGSVKGDGQFASPAGAYTSNPLLSGNLEFEFEVEYEKKQNTPKAEVEFKLGNLSFNGTSAFWLGVAGYKAQFSGAGKLNNQSGYDFLFTITDEDKKEGTKSNDKIRIKVWNHASSLVVYDNLPGAVNNANPSQRLTEGKIEIKR
jgi:hypothetical protein